MVDFYEVSHNSFRTRGFPWGQRILSGLELVKICYSCTQAGRRIERPQGEVELLLDRHKGSRWPDVLGCGAWPLLIVSGRVLDDWRQSGVRNIHACRVRIAEPLPRKLQTLPAPDYFWLDGAHMLGAKMNFGASGFVNVSFCSECGTRTDDISASYEKQQSGTWPMMFMEESWTGADVFTTDLSEAVFFCTEKVLECARKNKHTNFRFVPTAVAASSSDGVMYLDRE